MSLFPLRVCMVAPLPPPYGGIGNWTLLVKRYAQLRNDVNINIVDTSPHWRSIDDLTIWKRVIGGGVQLLRDYVRFFRELLLRPDVIHLTTSGQLAVFRDIAILAAARYASIPSIYHIRFGRIPEIAQNNTREWRMLARALRLSSVVIAIDEATASTISWRLPDLQVLRIPNGVDLTTLPAPVSPVVTIKTLMYLGWVIPSKGIAELCQALHNLLFMDGDALSLDRDLTNIKRSCLIVLTRKILSLSRNNLMQML